MVDRAGVSGAIKRRYGVELRAQWLEQCAAHIEQELGGARQREHLEAQVRLVVEQLVHAEIGDACHPSLAVDGATGQVRVLAGRPGTLLQVQSVVDVGVSKHSMWEAARETEDFEQRGIRPSYLPQAAADEGDSGAGFAGTAAEAEEEAAADLEAAGGRQPRIPRKLLKLELTDGRARVAALEVARIEQLSASMPIGTKVLVSGGQLLPGSGVLCLRPGDIHVVGGAPPQYAQHTLRARMAGLLGRGSERNA
ncbi:hypothetical protein GGI04_003661 [Coemansia thaxteri]|uniref:RecQ-mediated genome instability protein 1 n=1 Tax=Coemansia thaxteri TaxID=2663907 RepID=A0A9W8EH55_9FUNG|nr:hypothetical protein H4R26_004870 [Coemansia thaxteri]KAJ2001628.1 hypothetical protein GGI04_003661 [Coemansia thaxteri]KAJ2467868.1 hypothetical protein GGI02_003882 [Coemansia sp. RSA 2322]KAJ2476813.1 hypothetical protein EV174_004807 [Coemansia sp. RSA 2320]